MNDGPMILQVNGVELTFRSWDQMLQNAAQEIAGPYAFDEIPFEKGDVVIDVGGHRGSVACYLAKKYPGIKVYSYEPEPENFEELQWAIRENKLSRRVHAYNLAVTADGRDMEFFYGSHSGEGGGFHNPHPARHITVSSVTLASIFRKHRIKRCRLLKLDCEGAEHEILANADGLLQKVDYLRGEIHLTDQLRAQGYSAEKIEAAFPAERARWQRVG